MKYFMIGGDKREYGPVDADLIRQWLREGRANGETLLRAENETDWKPLRAFADFQEAPGEPSPTATTFATQPAEVSVSVGHAFARAWHLVGQHFGTIAGATVMVWMAFTAMMYTPCTFGVLAMLFYGPLFGGLFMLFLKLIREGEASAGDIFSLTRDSAIPLMMTGLLSIILVQVGTVCCCVLPGIYLQIAWLFSLPLVADRGLGFWEGLEMSRRTITRHWFKFFALFILSFLPFVVFHFYMMARQTADLAPYAERFWALIQEAMVGGAMNQSSLQAVSADIQRVEASYAAWAMIRQFLLLVSLPFGVGSLAFVYEDIFGRKK